MAKARRRIVYRKKAQNRFSLVLAGTVAAIVLGLIVPRGWKLRTQLREYTAQKESLEEQIASEEKRAEELEEYAKYTKTDEYVEKVAREKLGLVKKGEILFRSSGSEAAGSSGAAASGSTSPADGTAQASEGQDEENASAVQPEESAQEAVSPTEGSVPETQSQTEGTAQSAEDQTENSAAWEAVNPTEGNVQAGTDEGTAGTQE